MTVQELYKAKDPDIAASLAAMQRAAQEARKIAIQTNTAIIVVENNQIVRIPAEILRQENQSQENPI